MSERTSLSCGKRIINNLHLLSVIPSTSFNCYNENVSVLGQPLSLATAFGLSYWRLLNTGLTIYTNRRITKVNKTRAGT